MDEGRTAAWRVRRRIASALVTVTLAALVAPLHAEEAPAVEGEAARDRIVGNTLEGATADGPYTLFVASDGRLVSSDRDGRVDGTWVFKGGKFCTDLPDEDEECRALEISGPTGAFVDGDGSRYPFTIVPGNPKGL